MILSHTRTSRPTRPARPASASGGRMIKWKGRTASIAPAMVMAVSIAVGAGGMFASPAAADDALCDPVFNVPDFLGRPRPVEEFCTITADTAAPDTFIQFGNVDGDLVPRYFIENRAPATTLVIEGTNYANNAIFGNSNEIKLGTDTFTQTESIDLVVAESYSAENTQLTVESVRDLDVLFQSSGWQVRNGQGFTPDQAYSDLTFSSRHVRFGDPLLDLLAHLSGRITFTEGSYATFENFEVFVETAESEFLVENAGTLESFNGLSAFGYWNRDIVRSVWRPDLFPVDPTWDVDRVLGASYTLNNSGDIITYSDAPLNAYNLETHIFNSGRMYWSEFNPDGTSNTDFSYVGIEWTAPLITREHIADGEPLFSLQNSGLVRGGDTGGILVLANETRIPGGFSAGDVSLIDHGDTTDLTDLIRIVNNETGIIVSADAAPTSGGVIYYEGLGGFVQNDGIIGELSDVYEFSDPDIQTAGSTQRSAIVNEYNGYRTLPDLFVQNPDPADLRAVAFDLEVVNGETGRIYSDGGWGIVSDGELRLTNAGLIHQRGLDLGGDDLAAIAIRDAGNSFRSDHEITNSGTILGSRSAIEADGADGDTFTLVNSGDILVTDPNAPCCTGVVSADFFQSVTVTNAAGGHIGLADGATEAGSEYMPGLVVFLSDGDAAAAESFVLDNAGRIESSYALDINLSNANAVGVAAVVDITNRAGGVLRGIGTGDGLSYDTDAIGIYGHGPAPSAMAIEIENAGLISGAYDGIHFSSTVGALPGDGGSTALIRNLTGGTIEGGTEGDPAGRAISDVSDATTAVGGVVHTTVENAGSIIGDVDLRGGDDRFVLIDGGTFDGNLLMGSGLDVFEVRATGREVSGGFSYASDLVAGTAFDLGLLGIDIVEKTGAGRYILSEEAGEISLVQRVDVREGRLVFGSDAAVSSQATGEGTEGLGRVAIGDAVAGIETALEVQQGLSLIHI